MPGSPVSCENPPAAAIIIIINNAINNNIITIKIITLYFLKNSDAFGNFLENHVVNVVVCFEKNADIDEKKGLSLEEDLLEFGLLKKGSDGSGFSLLNTIFKLNNIFFCLIRKFF